MNILGINAYHGNASAALVCDGQLIAAVEEERFNRVKYAAVFPSGAIRYFLKESVLSLADIDHVGERKAGFFQAIANRRRGKAGGVFHAVEALLLNRSDELAIADKRGGGVSVVGVDPKDVHREFLPV